MFVLKPTLRVCVPALKGRAPFDMIQESCHYTLHVPRIQVYRSGASIHIYSDDASQQCQRKR